MSTAEDAYEAHRKTLPISNDAPRWAQLNPDAQNLWRESTRKIVKSCGSCLHWRGEESTGFRQCLWPRPVLPFWARISDGMDHDDWTTADDGRRCATWAKETA
jgi:hypothetical protein